MAAALSLMGEYRRVGQQHTVCVGVDFPHLRDGYFSKVVVVDRHAQCVHPEPYTRSIYLFADIRWAV